jgi:hypothetical protein
MNELISNEAPAAANETSLEEQKKRLEAKITQQRLRHRGIEVDLNLIEELISHGHKVDKKKLSFLEEYRKGGQDVRTYLEGLLVQLKDKPVEDERNIKRFNKNLKLIQEGLDILSRRPDLVVLVDRESLQEIHNKINTILS